MQCILSICIFILPKVNSISTIINKYFVNEVNKSGDLSLDDHKREGRPEKCLDNDFQALLNENSCRTQQELAEVLGVDRTTIARHLKAMGKIAKVGK